MFYVPYSAGAFRVALVFRHAVEVVGHGCLAVALCPVLDEGVAPPLALDEVVATRQAFGGTHFGLEKGQFTIENFKTPLEISS